MGQKHLSSSRIVTISLIAIAAIFLGSILHFRPRGSASVDPSYKDIVPLDLELGGTVCLPPPATFQAERTVLIVTNNTCPACTSNRSFSEIVYRRCQVLKLPVVYITSAKPKDRRIGDELELAGRHVVRADLGLLGLTRLPSILAVDRSGHILSMRIGAVSTSTEDETLKEITIGFGMPSYLRLSSKDIPDRIRGQETYQLLAFSSSQNSLFSGAHFKRFRVDELSVRSKYEMDKAAPTFVECAPQAIKPFPCQDALLRMKEMGYEQLFAVDLQKRHASEYCR